jgi:hypothetical protein
MLLKHRLLQTVAELEQFSLLYQQKSHGIPVDMAFLEQSEVHVFCYATAPHNWIAGYVTSSQQPCRYLLAHSPETRSALLAQHGLNEADIAEIGAIWMDVRALMRFGRELSRELRWEIYQQMMGDAYALRKPIIMGGTVNPIIRQFQMQVTKHLFFEGEVMLGGKKQYIWQYYARCDEYWHDFVHATFREFSVKRGCGEEQALAS